MIIRHVLKFVVVLGLVAIFASAEDPQESDNLSVACQLDPDIIFPSDSGINPNESKVLLTVEGNGKPKEVPVYVVLAIDSSGSMEENDPQGNRKKAAENFVRMMNPSKDKVGIISWDNDIDFKVELNNSHNYVISKIQDVDSKGETNLDEGLQAAVDLFNNETDSKKVIIFLSDGEGDYTSSGTLGCKADLARDKGIIIHSIGLNVADTSAERCLRDMVTATGGEYYDAPSSTALENIYNNIGKVVLNVAANDVKIRYKVPVELNISNHSLEPDSEMLKGDDLELVWDIGTMSIGDILSISFNVSSSNVGSFDLGRPFSGANYTKNDDTGSEKFDGKTLTVISPDWIIPSGVSEANSGAFISVNTSSVDFNKLHQMVNVIYDVVEHDENRIIWKFIDTGDWAYVFADGDIFITSRSTLSLSKIYKFEDEFINIIGLLNTNGADISVDPQQSPIFGATYYSKDARIFHKIRYTGRHEYNLFLVVPDCSVKEARLTMIYRDTSSWSGWENAFWIGNKNVFDREAPGYVDITKELPNPGEYPVYLRDDFDDRDTTIIIEAITSPVPIPKEFVLHDEDFDITVYESNPSSMDLIALEDNITKHAIVTMGDVRAEEENVVLEIELENIGYVPLNPDAFIMVVSNGKVIFRDTIYNIGSTIPLENKTYKFELPVTQNLELPYDIIVVVSSDGNRLGLARQSKDWRGDSR